MTRFPAPSELDEQISIEQEHLDTILRATLDLSQEPELDIARDMVHEIADKVATPMMYDDTVYRYIQGRRR